MAQKSDIEALFNEVVGHNDAMIRRVCVAYATPMVAADDLYQEAMMAVWRGLAGFRGESALSTWVYRTTINACINFLRRSQRHRANVSIDAVGDVAGDTPATFENDDNHRRLHTLIAGLNELDKAIILMWLDERSYAEISDVTGLGRNVVGVRLNRIKSRLARCFDSVPANKNPERNDQ